MGSTTDVTMQNFFQSVKKALFSRNETERDIQDTLTGLVVVVCTQLL